MSYSRLNVNGTTTQNTNKLLGLFNKAANQTYNVIPKSLSRISKLNQEVEREWLLLGEPPLSPKTTTDATTEPMHDIESTILSDPSTSDIECIGKPAEQSDSDSTTDIDAIVAEYEQALKVTATGTMNTVRIPSAGSWWIAIVLIFIILSATLAVVIGIWHAIREIYIGCLVMVLIAAGALLFLPRYQCSSSHPSSFICVIAILSTGIMFGTILNSCWGPIIFWITAAILLYVRCDRYMCICIDNHYHRHQHRDDMREALVAGGGGPQINVTTLPHCEVLQDRIRAHR